ncbi:dTDP-4-dehydrorhamnose 3,5-epimerase family protein [Paenibacillus sp. YIM B09110]|uniref:dTDP-4-dehydrorhamnose 3,5-epimerase family protein n=1 Tax=Paenibacillus sp. YIM B09110 TaxID=3126102 RepID=UPI00301CDB90
MEGVYVIPTKKIVNDRGFLQEVQRNDETTYPGFGQVYITATNPGFIKAWYRHHIQTDQISLVSGEMLVVLYDSREGSATRNEIKEIILNEENPLLIQIPTGVWHGFKTIGDKPALLLHLNTVPYNFENVDEDRLPTDDPTIPYLWS